MVHQGTEGQPNQLYYVRLLEKILVVRRVCGTDSHPVVRGTHEAIRAVSYWLEVGISFFKIKKKVMPRTVSRQTAGKKRTKDARKQEQGEEIEVHRR